MNEASKGVRFEASVAELLKLSGLEVWPERITGHKKVDLYAEEKHLGTVRRIAVECKAYEAPITQVGLTNIYVNYRPLLDANLVDLVLLVTLNGLAPSAETMLTETRELSHLSYADLQNLVMDFRPYLAAQQHQYDEDGLSQYYMSLRAVDGEDLESQILEWVCGDSERPVAILGGYGVGKTTFARRMAFVLSLRALEDSAERIPILIRLGDISSEQSLEGLLGKHFTATNVVRNYSFDAFMSLNQAGRFVILLDGFDEMKHTLTWDEFRYNFRQLNRLVSQGSRVLLFGRPTAFLNDAEHRHALHGIRSVQGMELREPGWPDYREVHIAPFDRLQVEQFIQKYLDYKRSMAHDTKAKQNLDHARLSLAWRLSERRFADISRRPVQLKMLAEILPQWTGDLDDLTVTLLYDVFIDMIIERDQEKVARRQFTTETRRAFARQVAMFLWQSKREMSLTASDIPLSIVAQFAAPSDDIEAVRRDLVSACFLEKKLGDSLYFPHRSFQEFLVAEELLDTLASEKIGLEQIDAMLSEEVADFMVGMSTAQTLRQLQRGLADYRGTLTWRFARLWITNPAYGDYLLSQLRTTRVPWYPLFLTIAVLKGLATSMSAEDLCEILLQRMEGPNSQYALLCYLCIALLYSDVRDPNFLGAALSDLADTKRYVKVTEAASKRRGRRNANSVSNHHGRTQSSSAVADKNDVEAYRPDPQLEEVLGKVVVMARNRGLELGGTYPVLCKLLRSYCLISDWIDGSTIQNSDLSLPRKVEPSPTNMPGLPLTNTVYKPTTRSRFR